MVRYAKKLILKIRKFTDKRHGINAKYSGNPIIINVQLLQHSRRNVGIAVVFKT